MIEQEFRKMVTDLCKDGVQISSSLDGCKSHLWHMATGISGECTEFLECANYFDDTGIFDQENAVEELGDIYFYLVGLVNGNENLSINHNPLNIITGTENITKIASQIAIAGGGILDAVKKHCVYEKKIDTDLVQANIDKLISAMYKAYYIMGISHQEVIAENTYKLVGADNARYSTGSYSNEQAQNRSDKVNQQGQQKINPHMLMVIDNQLNPDKYTQEQLDENAADACVAYFAADAAADAAYAAANTAYYAAYDGADAAHWLNQYFKQTGENKQDYIDAINKDKQ